MNFLAMDKIFCLRQKIFVPDKFNFVLDKTYFVWADGMSISKFLPWCGQAPRKDKLGRELQAIARDSIMDV